MQDQHIIEVAGCRATIENGCVTDISDSRITFCPFAKRFTAPIQPVSPETVRKNIEFRISSFGMCTPHRQVLANESMVLFGASELMTTAFRTGFLDAAVICCDGAGTVIVRSPELVQGIGGRMSGLISTVAYPEVIQRIEDAGGIVIDKEQASLNPEAGIVEAKRRGFSRIAVTVAGHDTDTAESIRKHHPNVIIIAVHTSFISSEEEALRLFSVCDLVFACASKFIRKAAKTLASVQAGVGVPVFAASKPGKQMIFDRLMETDSQILVKNMPLPVCDMGKQPNPLI